MGSSATIVATQSGNLYLGFNDNHYFDNSGAFLVTNVPEPSSASLFALGLLAVSVIRHEKRRAT